MQRKETTGVLLVHAEDVLIKLVKTSICHSQRIVVVVINVELHLMIKVRLIERENKEMISQNLMLMVMVESLWTK
jgi:hypothetical protein